MMFCTLPLPHVRSPTITATLLSCRAGRDDLRRTGAEAIHEHRHGEALGDQRAWLRRIPRPLILARPDHADDPPCVQKQITDFDRLIEHAARIEPQIQHESLHVLATADAAARCCSSSVVLRLKAARRM